MICRVSHLDQDACSWQGLCVRQRIILGFMMNSLNLEIVISLKYGCRKKSCI